MTVRVYEDGNISATHGGPHVIREPRVQKKLGLQANHQLSARRTLLQDVPRVMPVHLMQLQA